MKNSLINNQVLSGPGIAHDPKPRNGILAVLACLVIIGGALLLFNKNHQQTKVSQGPAFTQVKKNAPPTIQPSQSNTAMKNLKARKSLAELYPELIDKAEISNKDFDIYPLKTTDPMMTTGYKVLRYFGGEKEVKYMVAIFSSKNANIIYQYMKKSGEFRVIGMIGSNGNPFLFLPDGTIVGTVLMSSYNSGKGALENFIAGNYIVTGTKISDVKKSDPFTFLASLM